MEILTCASLPALSENLASCTSVLDTATSLGIRGIEVKLGRNDLISKDMRTWLFDKLPSYDFTVYTHLPYLQGQNNIASPDSDKASRARNVMLESIEFSAGLGCEMVNSHLGVKLGRGPHIPRAASRLATIARKSSDIGIEISVENQESSCNGILNSPEDVKTLVEYYPEVKLTYDAGHGNTHGFGIAEFLPAVMDRLSYLHLHDNNGKRDQHLALGKGNLDLGLLIGELGRRELRNNPLPLTLELAPQDLGTSLSCLNALAGNKVSFK